MLCHSLNLSDVMKFIIWNTIGTNSASFRRQCDSLVKTPRLVMVVLLETKMVDHKNLTEMLYFDTYLESSVTGRKGGIVII